MPAQRTGIGNGEAVRVVAVEMATGEITTQTLASLSGMNSNSNSLDAVSDDYNQLASEDLNLNTLENLEVLQNVDNDTTDQTSESEQVILKVDGSHLTNVVTVTQNDVSERSQEIQVAKAGNAAELPSVASVPNANDKTSALKRQLSTPPSSNPVVTKVIITKNPLTSQPQPVPVNLNQVQLGQGQAVSMSSIVPGISILPGGQTPTKTITISPQGIVSSPGKQIIATIPSSPAKLTGIPVNKVPISPAKTPTKITMIPVTIGKSPQRIAPASIAQVSMLTKSLSDSGATLTPVTVVTNSGTRPTMITMSPSKVFKQGTVIQQKTGHIQIQPNQTIAINKSQLIQQSSGLRPITISNVHQVQGSKFQYVRLVTPSSQVNPSVKTAIPMTSIVQAKNIVATTTSTQPSAPQIKITLPVTGPQLMPKPVVNQNTQSVQRILLPAPSNTTTQQSTITLSAATAPTTLAQIRPSFQTNQLPPGTTILSGSDAPQNVQGFALVPASYVAQIQQQIQTKPQTATPQTPQPTLVRQEFIPIASNDPNISANAMARGVPINGTSIEPTGARPRKPCNCTKSQCLKLYCDCFANGEFCHNCNCNNCANNLEHEEERSRAIKSCLDRNPMAFHPKIGKGKGKDGERDRRHNKGCNCKRSGCLKNYCECYEAKIMCSSTCKCIGCKNFEESPERKTLMHLADAAEVRVQQQTAAKSKLSSQISGIPSRPPVSSATGERLPYTFITAEVAEATCACLLAQAEEADKIKMPPVVQERMVIEEFGRCLLQIIDSANRTKGLLSRGSSDKQPD